MGKILLVEDNLANRQLAQFLLEQAGHQVLCCTNAEEAFAALETGETVDLVLIDIQLPKLDGLTATRRLRADPRFSRLKIAAMTAFAMKGDEERALSAGCDAYIVKPIRYKEFLATVDRLISREPSD